MTTAACQITPAFAEETSDSCGIYWFAATSRLVSNFSRWTEINSLYYLWYWIDLFAGELAIIQGFWILNVLQEWLGMFNFSIG